MAVKGQFFSVAVRQNSGPSLFPRDAFRIDASNEQVNRIRRAAPETRRGRLVAPTCVESHHLREMTQVFAALDAIVEALHADKREEW